MEYKVIEALNVSCFNCIHYRQSQVENECMVTRDYCYPAHKVKCCEYFEAFDWDLSDLEKESGENE